MMLKRQFKNLIFVTAAVFAAVVFTGCKGDTGTQTVTPTADVTHAVIMTEAPDAVLTEAPAAVTEAPEIVEEPTSEPPTSTPAPRQYNMDEFTIVGKAESGNTVTYVELDVSAMKNFGVNADYLVTAVFGENDYTQVVVKAADGVVHVDFEKPVLEYEVSVVLKYSLGKDTSSAEDGYVNIPWTEVYDATKDAGFEGKVDTHPRGVNLRTDSYCFVAAIPDGMYDVTVKKAEMGRSTLRINEGSFGVNVGIGGTDRKGEDKIFSAQDIVVEGGEARLSSIGDGNMCYIEFRRVSQLIPRKTHIYIAGDSTIQTYYPRLDEAEFAAGTAQTGWGQLFHHYTTDEVIVDSLGAGGTYARSWYEMYFKGITNNAKPGDYFIIQEGINDRTYSNTEEMKEYLSIMIDWCLEHKVVPVLVTSQQTAKFWKSKDGADLGEHDEPEGSGLYPFAETIRELAKEKGVFLIDNAKMTGEWYSIVGRTYVEQTYHLYNAKTEKSVDSLHSSFQGSKKISELIATDIASRIASEETDAYGNTLAGIKLNDVISYTFEYSVASGEINTTIVNAVEYK